MAIQMSHLEPTYPYVNKKHNILNQTKLCICVYACVCIFVCECLYVYRCVCLCMYLCVCLCVCLCLFVCVCVCIWLKSTRTYPSKQSAGNFPQIVFTLVIGVKPIKVRFPNRFLRLSDKRLLTILIKKKLKKINFRMRFQPLKIAFFWVFENDNISSSKSYTATKSRISPQRKLGSLQNLKLKLIRH